MPRFDKLFFGGGGGGGGDRANINKWAKSSKSYHLGQKINFIKLCGVLYGWKAYNLYFLDMYLDFNFFFK